MIEGSGFNGMQRIYKLQQIADIGHGKAHEP